MKTEDEFQCADEFEQMARIGPNRRFCEQCQHEVHDLRNATRARFEALEATGQAYCAAYIVDDDGHMIFREEPTKKRRPVWLTAAAAILPALGCQTEAEDMAPSPISIQDGQVAIIVDSAEEQEAAAEEGSQAQNAETEALEYVSGLTARLRWTEVTRNQELTFEFSHPVDEDLAKTLEITFEPAMNGILDWTEDRKLVWFRPVRDWSNGAYRYEFSPSFQEALASGGHGSFTARNRMLVGMINLDSPSLQPFDLTGLPQLD